MIPERVFPFKRYLISKIIQIAQKHYHLKQLLISMIMSSFIKKQFTNIIVYITESFLLSALNDTRET